ncbi:TIGR03643 family protein [Vreelandella sp. EE22]
MSKAPIERFYRLLEDERSRVIEMAWEDRTPFEAIVNLYGLTEPDVIDVMRHELKPASFRLWRKRVSGRPTKHRALRLPNILRGYCPTQYKRL